MSIRKGWPLISIIIGLATLLVIWLAFTLLSSIESSRSQMLLMLYEPHQPVGHYYSTLDTAYLFILVFILTMFLCGIIASLVSRPSGLSALKAQYAPLLAASIPLIVIDLFQAISYFNNTQDYYRGNFGPGPYYPTEPPFLPVYLLFMAILTIPGLILAAAGGILAWWAVNSGKP